MSTTDSVGRSPANFAGYTLARMALSEMMNTYVDSAKAAFKQAQSTLTMVAVALTTAFSMPQVLGFDDVDIVSLLATIPWAVAAVLYFTKNNRLAAIAIGVGIVLSYVAKGEISLDTMELLSMWILTLVLVLLPHQHADIRNGLVLKAAIALGAWLGVALLSVLINSDVNTSSFANDGFFSASNLLTLLNAGLLASAVLALLRVPMISFSIAVFMQITRFVDTFSNQFAGSFDIFPLWLRIEQIVLAFTFWLPLVIVAAVFMKSQAKPNEGPQTL